MTRHTEVLVAGAGPVGLSLANLLGRYGRRWEFMLFDDEPSEKGTFGSIIKPTDRRVTASRGALSRPLNLSPRVKEYVTDMRFKPIPRYSRGVVVEPDSLTPGVSAPKRRSRLMTVRNAVDRRTPVQALRAVLVAMSAATSAGGGSR